MNIQDKWLIWRFNRGDCEAVREMYERYKNDLVALAAALLKDLTAAEDVVHDVFVSFLQLRSFRLTGSLKGYLATCVANSARNVIRAKSRHPQGTLEEAALEVPVPGPDEQAISCEQRRLIDRAVGELPFEQREVLLLHLRGGLKFAEIADSQEVSINTVLGRYRYALEKLRAKLNGEVSKCDRMTQSKE